MSGRVVESSALCRETWVVDEAVLTLEVPIQSEVRRVEDLWKPHREEQAHGWDWCEAMTQHPDRYGVRKDGAGIISLWAGQYLSARRAYLLHFFEIAPDHRGAGIWGPFALLVVKARALELGASSLVLHSYPNRAEWYRRNGAHGTPQGWSPVQGLVTLGFQGSTLATSRNILDAHRRPATP